jgi:hypothetical protein
MSGFYDGILPKNLGKIMQKYDPDVRPVRADTLTSHEGFSELGQGFTLFPITDKVREQVRAGQPMFANPLPNLPWQRREERPALRPPNPRYGGSR